MSSSDSLRLKQVVEPDNYLYYNVQIVKERSSFIWFNSKAIVNSQEVASASFSCKGVIQ